MFEKDQHPTVEEALNIEVSRPKREDGSKDLVITVTIKRKIFIPDEENEPKQPAEKNTVKETS